MSGRADEAPRGRVSSGVAIGLLGSLIFFLILLFLPPQLGIDSGPVLGWIMILVPLVVGAVLLAVPRWRRAANGYLLGIAVGSIIFAGACSAGLFVVSRALP